MPDRMTVIAALSILQDSLILTNRRAGAAAKAAESVDALLQQQLLNVRLQLAGITDAISDALDELHEENEVQ